MTDQKVVRMWRENGLLLKILEMESNSNRRNNERKYAIIYSTYSGILIDLANPTIEDILVPDLAHHLANTCRFTGACRTGYSVAQHCILVAELN